MSQRKNPFCSPLQQRVPPANATPQNPSYTHNPNLVQTLIPKQTYLAVAVPGVQTLQAAAGQQCASCRFPHHPHQVMWAG